MNITNDKPVTIYANNFDDVKRYSCRLARKKLNEDSYEYGYIPIKFKQGVDLETKNKIIIKNAFLTFYKKDNQTIPYIFVLDFDLVKEDNIEKQETEDLFADFGKEVKLNDIEITNSDLPF